MRSELELACNDPRKMFMSSVLPSASNKKRRWAVYGQYWALSKEQCASNQKQKGASDDQLNNRRTRASTTGVEHRKAICSKDVQKVTFHGNKLPLAQEESPEFWIFIRKKVPEFLAGFIPEDNLKVGTLFLKIIWKAGLYSWRQSQISEFLPVA